MATTVKIAIIDASYSRDPARFRGMAAKWLHWEAGRLGANLMADASSADVVLVTFPAPQDVELISRSLRKVGIQPNRQKRGRTPSVIVGGGIGLSPAILDDVADAVCVGEGRTFLRTLVTDGFDEAWALPNAWIPGETRPVVPDSEFPWDLPPIRYEDGIVRVFASRGCHKKCLFCQTGWAQQYVEAPNPKTVEAVQDVLLKRGERVNLVTNDATALSFYRELAMVEHFSASYSQTMALLQDRAEIVHKVKSIRFGVEAVSERLRRAVGKPIPTDKMVRLSANLLAQGIGIRWFMIAGLPGERDDDWDELRAAVMEIKRHATKGVVQLSFTAFCPDPAAPLCIAPLDDGYWERWERFRRWFFEDVGFSRRVQLLRPAAPKGRLVHAMNSMAASEEQLRRGWEDCAPPNWRVEYPYKRAMHKAWQTYKRRIIEAPNGKTE